MAKAVKKRGRVKKEKKNIPNGIVHIQSTFNNTIVTVTDTAGNVIAQSSAGAAGFKGSRKSTPFAAQLAGRNAIQQAMEHGMRVAEVRVKGPGALPTWTIRHGGRGPTDLVVLSLVPATT